MTTASGRTAAALRGALRGSLIRAISWYRMYISPARPPACRFTPSCSEYAIDALTSRGVLMGLWLTTWRLLRCGPWSAGGWDPVPAHPAHPSHLYEGAPR
ncbi:membrane protein insertion efficiency factor YidD [Segniliparus rugosus]|uniref:membrane protein insertion efficiency factor YidD n=1 Tax=Segniliparus rugosus TaxID=286804 RepID=UPI0002D2F315|nr:membrane protein insertion efficiency factor YidD [Segniliparus rugosus]